MIKSLKFVDNNYDSILLGNVIMVNLTTFLDIFYCSAAKRRIFKMLFDASNPGTNSRVTSKALFIFFILINHTYNLYS